MKDVSDYGISFRGYPVTLVSDDVDTLLQGIVSRYGADKYATAIGVILAAAVDTAEHDEPSGWLFTSWLFDSPSSPGVEVNIERFGGIRSTDRHEGGMWSVYRPSER